MTDDLRFAILIDAENISSKYIKLILEEVAGEGIATYRRIYGDWTSSLLASWKQVLLDYSITPIQQYSYTAGKNSTDSAMIIDAMDILYSGKVDGFCLVTSDSDFTRLAMRLREAGMTVIGMGEQKTPRPFIAACNQFKFIDMLFKEQMEPAEPTQAAAADPVSVQGPEDTPSQTNQQTIKKAMVEFIESRSDEDGWMLVSELGNLLRKRYADFDVRNFGYKKMVPFIKSLGVFEVRSEMDTANLRSPNSQVVYVRLRNNRN